MSNNLCKNYYFIPIYNKLYVALIIFLLISYPIYKFT